MEVCTKIWAFYFGVLLEPSFHFISCAGVERQGGGRHKGFQEPEPSDLLQRSGQPGEMNERVQTSLGAGDREVQGHGLPHHQLRGDGLQDVGAERGGPDHREPGGAAPHQEGGHPRGQLRQAPPGHAPGGEAPQEGLQSPRGAGERQQDLPEVRQVQEEQEHPGPDRDQVLSLSCPECDFTFISYNYLKQHTTEEEARLIEGDVNGLDERLKPAEMTLNWQCEDIIDYLEDIQVLLNTELGSWSRLHVSIGLKNRFQNRTRMFK